MSGWLILKRNSARKRISLAPDSKNKARGLPDSGVSLRDVGDVTQLLRAMAHGDSTASEKLVPLVYAELRRMAARRMNPGAGGQTLQPTALVHEAWLRLGGDNADGWENRAHFFATAATAMRSILVDRARRRRAARHGGGQQHLNIDEVQVSDPCAHDDQVLAVHEALEKLAAEDPGKAELVKLRYFGGFTLAEAAEILGISEPTAKRWWAYARAWLGHEIRF